MERAPRVKRGRPCPGGDDERRLGDDDAGPDRGRGSNGGNGDPPEPDPAFPTPLAEVTDRGGDLHERVI